VSISPSSPIGIFDSGVGGLTVVTALRRLVPNERLIYLADAARQPYGTKSPKTVIRYALQAAQYLQSHEIKLLVIACNTASAHAAQAVRKALAPLPVLGVVEAGADAAVHASPQGHIVVAATEGTCLSGAFPKLIAAQSPQARVTQVPCPLFVAVAEEGLGDNPIADAIARRYLGEHFAPDSGNDTLLLGCTHFPLLMPALRRLTGPQVQIVDCADAVAAKVGQTLQAQALAAPASQQGDLRLIATDAQARLANLASTLMPQLWPMPQVSLIDL
jgi:glutamate racemase